MIEYVEHDGGLVAYQVQGRGPIDILHLPAWLTSIDVIDEEPHITRFNRRLAGIGRLIEFDLPGVGLPTRRGEDFTVEQLAGAAIRVLDAIGSEVAVVVAQGAGPVAIHLAATRNRNGYGALVLVNTTARMLEGGVYPDRSSRVAHPRLHRRQLDSRG